jgi:hypothetical protein
MSPGKQGPLGMESEQEFKLRFIRTDGKREQARLSHHSPAQVRDLAELVFERSGDLYSEVEILRDGRHFETIQNPARTNSRAAHR